MKIHLLIGCLFFTTLVYGQDPSLKKLKDESLRAIKKAEEDTAFHKWNLGGMFNVNVAQGSLTNWAAGGDEFSLSINSLFSLYGFYKEGRHSWDNTFDLNFGYISTTSLGNRKNDDRIDFLSKYGYSITPKLNLASLFNFRSQLFKGYTYPTDSTKELSSNFLSPANILLSLGLNYKPSAAFSVFVSPVTTRWILVKDDSLSAKGVYGVKPGEHSKSELGAFLTANFTNDFNKVVAYKSRIDLFSNYKNKPQNIDIFWTNLLAVKLTKVLSVSWNVDLIYDDDVRIFGKDGNDPAAQIKSIIGIGLMFKFK